MEFSSMEFPVFAFTTGFSSIFNAVSGEMFLSLRYARNEILSGEMLSVRRYSWLSIICSKGLFV
jgi:hypothetical protein